jgi:Phage tail tube protein, GTA-gp10
MMANEVRGEVALQLAGQNLVLRPSFAALVAAEAELGPLFAVCERAAAGQLTLSEMVGLMWHCLAPSAAIARADFADAVVAGGLANASPALRGLLGQILAGQ